VLPPRAALADPGPSTTEHGGQYTVRHRRTSPGTACRDRAGTVPAMELDNANDWTACDLSWQEFVAGSAVAD
jgi:hypothetical protein